MVAGGEERERSWPDFYSASPTVLQSALEELTPLNDAGNIFGHIFSKTIDFAMLK